MQDTIIIAIVAALAAVAGGLITGVIAPLVRYKLDRRIETRTTRMESIDRWRKMLADGHDNLSKYGENIGIYIQAHHHYSSLVPHLDPAVRVTLGVPSPTLEAGHAFPKPLELLRSEIERLETEWKLR